MKKVAILTGWPWYERNIALKSSKFFEKYLQVSYDTYILPEALEEFISKREEYDAVIPVFHGEYGEDGKIIALLELFNIPFVGSSYFTNALCMNKKEANIVGSSAWLNIPKELCVSQGSIFDERNFSLSFPVIVKPNKWGSSYHTYKVEDIENLKKKIQTIQENIEDDILIQEYILWDEYSVSVVNGEILPIMMLEKENKEDFFDYESKYESESGMKEVFGKVEKKIQKKLEEETKKACTTFNIKGYCRVDFIIREDTAYFLEVNTIPGTTEASILPKAWKLTWRTFHEFTEVLLKNI